MTSTLLVLLILSLAEGTDNPLDGAMEPQLFGRSLELAAKGLVVGMGQPGARLRPGALAFLGLGVDNAR